jgi:hypothetical protein
LDFRRQQLGVVMVEEVVVKLRSPAARVLVRDGNPADVKHSVVKWVQSFKP